MWGWIILGALALGVGVALRFKAKPFTNGSTTTAPS